MSWIPEFSFELNVAPGEALDVLVVCDGRLDIFKAVLVGNSPWAKTVDGGPKTALLNLAEKLEDYARQIREEAKNR